MTKVSKKRRLCLVSLTIMLMLAFSVTSVQAADPTFRGIVYDIGNDTAHKFVELTPLQYVQFRNAANPNVVAVVKNGDVLRPLKAIVDSRGYVFTALMYVQKGKSYANLTEADQVAGANFEFPDQGIDAKRPATVRVPTGEDPLFTATVASNMELQTALQDYTNEAINLLTTYLGTKLEDGNTGIATELSNAGVTSIQLGSDSTIYLLSSSTDRSSLRTALLNSASDLVGNGITVTFNPGSDNQRVVVFKKI